MPRRIPRHKWGNRAWVPASWLPSRFRSVTELCDRIPQSQARYLALLTKDAIRNGVALASLYEPGGIIFETAEEIAKNKTSKLHYKPLEKWTSRLLTKAWNKFKNSRFPDEKYGEPSGGHWARNGDTQEADVDVNGDWDVMSNSDADSLDRTDEIRTRKRNDGSHVNGEDGEDSSGWGPRDDTFARSRSLELDTINVVPVDPSLLLASPQSVDRSTSAPDADAPSAVPSTTLVYDDDEDGDNNIILTSSLSVEETLAEGMLTDSAMLQIQEAIVRELSALEDGSYHILMKGDKEPTEPGSTGNGTGKGMRATKPCSCRRPHVRVLDPLFFNVDSPNGLAANTMPRFLLVPGAVDAFLAVVHHKSLGGHWSLVRVLLDHGMGGRIEHYDPVPSAVRTAQVGDSINAWLKKFRHSPGPGYRFGASEAFGSVQSDPTSCGVLVLAQMRSLLQRNKYLPHAKVPEGAPEMRASLLDVFRRFGDVRPRALEGKPEQTVPSPIEKDQTPPRADVKPQYQSQTTPVHHFGRLGKDRVKRTRAESPLLDDVSGLQSATKRAKLDVDTTTPVAGSSCGKAVTSTMPVVVQPASDSPASEFVPPDAFTLWSSTLSAQVGQSETQAQSQLFDYALAQMKTTRTRHLTMMTRLEAERHDINPRLQALREKLAQTSAKLQQERDKSVKQQRRYEELSAKLPNFAPTNATAGSDSGSVEEDEEDEEDESFNITKMMVMAVENGMAQARQTLESIARRVSDLETEEVRIGREQLLQLAADGRRVEGELAVVRRSVASTEAIIASMDEYRRITQMQAMAARALHERINEAMDTKTDLVIDSP